MLPFLHDSILASFLSICSRAISWILVYFLAWSSSECSVQDAVLLPYQSTFYTTFLTICDGRYGFPHVLDLSFGVSKDLFSVKHIHSNKFSFMCYLDLMKVIKLLHS